MTTTEPASTDLRTIREVRDPAQGPRSNRALRATYGIVDLLARRGDLRDVYPPADALEDSVTWCA